MCYFIDHLIHTVKKKSNEFENRYFGSFKEKGHLSNLDPNKRYRDWKTLLGSIIKYTEQLNTFWGQFVVSP